MDDNRRAADDRTAFEQVLFRLTALVKEKVLRAPECFISYAWGDPEQERWVEKSLATDLKKAGIKVVLDRWDNAAIGSSVPRFVERVAKCDRVLVVGTKVYLKKYKNDKPMRPHVLAAEGDLIGKRMIGTEKKKASVLPLLLDGTDKTSLPSLLEGRVYSDFRQLKDYFRTALDLLLTLYDLKPQDPVAIDLRESLEKR